jgi:hypothetical protein
MYLYPNADFYKEQFLKLINLPFGLSQFARLKKLQGNTVTPLGSVPHPIF